MKLEVIVKQDNLIFNIILINHSTSETCLLKQVEDESIAKQFAVGVSSVLNCDFVQEEEINEDFCFNPKNSIKLFGDDD